MNHMQGDFTLTELPTGWLEPGWTSRSLHCVFSDLISLQKFNDLLAMLQKNLNNLDELIGWTDCSWTVFLVTLLLEYLGECTIRVTVSLEYLDRAFSAFGCLLFYNSLIFNSILLSFGKDLLCLFHLHNLFLWAVCVILAETLDFLITQNQLHDFYQELRISFVSYVINF